MSVQTAIHYSLHFILPGIIAFGFFREKWLRVYLILIATMAVDLDHLLASPLFDPCRCSIGFHPLHSYWACGLYVVALFSPRFRVVAIGLLMHMLTDGIDCIMSAMNNSCM